MNTDSCSTGECRPCCGVLGGWFIAILGTFLIFGGLVWVMYRYAHPAPLTSARAVERKKNLAELRASDADALNNYGWVDQARGLVRLPISNAMELVVKEYANPEAAKSNMVVRATPPPPVSFE